MTCIALFYGIFPLTFFPLRFVKIDKPTLAIEANSKVPKVARLQLSFPHQNPATSLRPSMPMFRIQWHE